MRKLSLISKNLRYPFYLFLSLHLAMLFSEEEKPSLPKGLKNHPDKLVVETKKESLMKNIGFSYEDSSLEPILSGFSGNAYYSHPFWKGEKIEAKVNMGGSLSMVDAEVIDFEDMAGNSAGAQLGLKFEEDAKMARVVTSFGLDLFQTLYDSKSRSSTGVKMHYGFKF